MSKKVLILSTYVPFIYGGNVNFINWFYLKLKEYYPEFLIDNILIPFSDDPDLVLKQIEGLKNLKFNYGDILITSRPFSYVVEHSNKIIWFMHHLRYLYDLWDTKFNPLNKNDKKNIELRKKITEIDNKALRSAKKIFAISKNVANRLKKFNNIDAEVLYPPLFNEKQYYSESYSDYIYFPSRITGSKRQHIPIQAMKYTKTNVKLIISGNIEGKYFKNKIQPLLRDNEISSKVKIIDKYINEDEKLKLYANALAIVFTPYDEDYGYITLEAFYSKKLVITLMDSGGPTEFIENEYNGFILENDLKNLAEIFDKIYLNKDLAKKMGGNAYSYILSKKITWDTVFEKIFEESNVFSNFLSKNSNFLSKIKF
ncbi:MAG: glycosyltransferase family 4 protein [bacterium]